MLTKVLLFVSLCAVVVADHNHVIFKRCTDVDPDQCTVHSVNVNPCLHAPNFCTFIQDKIYSLNVNLTPKFTAENLKLGVYTDVNESGYFTAVRTYKDACRSILTCPLEAHIRQGFDVAVTLDKSHYGKFPLMVKLWNADDESQACCLTFKVKAK